MPQCSLGGQPPHKMVALALCSCISAVSQGQIDNFSAQSIKGKVIAVYT